MKTYASRLYSTGWRLGLRHVPRRGYESVAVRGTDLIRSYAADPEESFRRTWETAEQRDPVWECDSCGAATRDMVELTGSDAQVCPECFVRRENERWEAENDEAG